MKKSPRIVMAFGAFDAFHEGHRFFLKTAKEKGEGLVVVVAPDKAVFDIKNKWPNNHLDERVRNVLKEKIADEVIAGDSHQGSWQVLKKYQPKIIALGYDQKRLRETLQKILPKLDFKFKIITITPFKPEEFYSRFIKHPRNTIRLSGQIERGKKEAGRIGFPTINIPLETEHPSGIYAGIVHFHGIEYKAAIYIGPEKRALEAHILDFKEGGELYGEWVVIEIGEKIRDVVTSKSIQEMKELIKKDIEAVKSLNSIQT